MLGSYRCIFVAIAGLALAGPQQPSEQRQTGQGTQQAQSAAQATATPTPTAEPPYRPYADYQPDPCYNTENHDAADLCAQWRSAVAAEKTARESRRATSWAIVATILSFLTVAGLIVTIWQTHGALGEARRGNIIAQKGSARATRRAIASAKDTQAALKIARQNANAAKLTADASERAIAETQRIGEAQVRCYLSTVDCTLIYKLDRWQAVATVRNSGRSPARTVTWNPSLTLLVGGKGLFRTVEAAKQSVTMHVDVPAGRERELGFAEFFLPLEADERTALSEGYPLTIKLEANIRGRDVFNNEFDYDGEFIGELRRVPVMGTVVKLIPAVKVEIAPRTEPT